MLCDTGPLIALLDADDSNHERCLAVLKDLPPEPLRVTWACFTEAMHLLYRVGEFQAQDKLWELVASELVVLDVPSESEWRRIRMLMAKYADTPMDLGDATVVATAERLATRKLFTIDSHFRIYRTLSGDAFEIVP